MDLISLIKSRYPWLVAEWNGVAYEATVARMERRMTALEEHVQLLAARCNSLENALLNHSQGRNHRPAGPRIPKADEES